MKLASVWLKDALSPILLVSHQIAKTCLNQQNGNVKIMVLFINIYSSTIVTETNFMAGDEDKNLNALQLQLILGKLLKKLLMVCSSNVLNK